MIDNFVPYILVSHLNILLTGPIIVACQWNTGETEKNMHLNINNFKSISRNIIDGSYGINWETVFTHSLPQLVQQNTELVGPSAGLTVPTTRTIKI